MTEPPTPHGPGPQDEAPEERGGEVRHLPVLVPPPEPRALDRPRVALATPVVAATGGVLAGMLTMALVRLLRPRHRTIVLRRRRRGDRGLEVAASRSFLVDVHLLRR